MSSLKFTKKVVDECFVHHMRKICSFRKCVFKLSIVRILDLFSKHEGKMIRDVVKKLV